MDTLTDQQAYETAVEMNDLAHRREIKTVAESSTAERQERFREIQQEARVWLRHLDSIHGRR